MLFRSNGRLNVSENAVTSGGNLPCAFIVHAVGPYFHDVAPHKAIVELYNCIENVLKRVNDELCCETISIPAISSGLFGFPVKLCAETIFEAIENEMLKRKP